MHRRQRVVEDIRPNLPQKTASRDTKHKHASERMSFFAFFRKSVFVPPVLLFVSFIFLGSVLAPVTSGTVAGQDMVAQIAEASTATNVEQERSSLEKQLAELEQQMAEYEKTISDYKRQGVSLKNEIGSLDAKMKQLDLKIQSVTISLQKLDQEIESTTDQISEIEQNIDSKRVAISSMLQRMYEYDKEGLIDMLLANPKLSDFFGSVNDLMTVQDGVHRALGELDGLHTEVVAKKEELVTERTDAVSLRASQKQQKQSVEDVRVEKDTILAVTKGKESAYQKLLEDTKKTAAEIRSRIFRLVGGGELTFGEAYELAKIAEQTTGIRAAFILAILTQESGVNGLIGANLGQCYYHEKRPNADGAVMRKREQVVFIDLMRELGKDPETTPVSCPIVSDGAYGGAMGPAQFMPSTWNLYKDRIGGVTGANPPSPFNNLDAIVGTALYLKDSYESSSCRTYKSDSCRDYGLCSVDEVEELLERCAASKYYAGSRWYTFRWAYGEPVVERAQKFQKDIDVLEGR
ncbi:MAG: hypothetical protein V1652_03430 [bacterium]